MTITTCYMQLCDNVVTTGLFRTTLKQDPSSLLQVVKKLLQLKFLALLSQLLLLPEIYYTWFKVVHNVGEAAQTQLLTDLQEAVRL